MTHANKAANPMGSGAMTEAEIKKARTKMRFQGLAPRTNPKMTRIRKAGSPSTRLKEESSLKNSSALGPCLSRSEHLNPESHVIDTAASLTV
jgi:hypothetical protein